MAYEVVKTIRGRQYRYAVESYRDADTGKVRNKWRYLGKADSNQVPVRRTRGPETRTKLMDALERLLDRDSWSDVTVRNIAAEAGVAEATYYRHFQSRSELLHACAARVLEMLEERFEALRAIAATRDDERKRLRKLVVEAVSDPPGAAVMYALWTAGETGPLRAERRARRQRALRAYLCELRDRGYATFTDADIEELSNALALLLQSFSYRTVIERRHLNEGEYEAVAAIVDRLVFR
jgi:AcrR family transcriptional regulator